MLCEKCGKNEATFYYKENINGTEKAYHLCADCAKKLEESGEIRSFDGNFFDSMNKIFSGDNLFGSLFAPIGQRHALGAGNREKKTCPLCGSTFEDIVENGKLGCPMCYEVFGDALPATIQRIHGRTKHTGNVPKRFRAALEAKEKLQKLEDAKIRQTRSKRGQSDDFHSDRRGNERNEWYVKELVYRIR